MAKAGADLVITTHSRNWAETAELIEKEGRKAVFVQADLTKKEDRQNVVKCELASRASDYVNGHVLAVDGGWLVR